MPEAVTHILIPILLVAIFRDFYKSINKKKFPLHYVLIAGLGGVLPDIDIVFSVIQNLIGIQTWDIHKTFTHSLFFPLILFALFIILKPVNVKARICNIGKHNLKLSIISLMLSIGILIHILLDTLFGGPSYLFYPLLITDYAIYIFDYLPRELRSLAPPLLDGILLVIWLAYLELKHKISDFI